MYGRDLLSLYEYDSDEIKSIINLALKLKNGVHPPSTLKGKNILALFEKPSTRTRISMEVATESLGGHFIYIDKTTTQLARGETLKDFALVTSRYVDLIAVRAYDHNDLVEISKWAEVPVVNMLTDRFHPLQALADVMTIIERKKGRVTIAFLGDGSANTCHSLMLASSKMGWEFRVGCPKALTPNPEVYKIACKSASNNKGSVLITDDPLEAAKDADVVYTDTWFSMGIKRSEERIKLLLPYQVNSKLLSHARKDVIVMHCLPWYIGEEITSDVAYGPKSVVWDQAENRLHTAKAVLLLLLTPGLKV